MKKELIKKIGVVLVIAIVVVLFYVFDLGRYFNLQYMKEAKDGFAQLYQENQALVIGAYMLIYIVMAAFSLPGAAVLTLLGGALFGLVVGTIAVSFASTIGATLACIVSRYVLRDWVQSKFSDRLEPINRGIEKEGAFYLFTLRLIPVFPFFVINLVMGLTNMRLWSFYWVSQVGMFAGTIVYVNAGKELGQLDSLSGILSPSLIASFVLIGLLPIVSKKAISFFRAKKGTVTEQKDSE